MPISPNRASKMTVRSMIAFGGGAIPRDLVNSRNLPKVMYQIVMLTLIRTPL